MTVDIPKMKEMLALHGSHGNWNFDPYMHGLYNGMEFMLSIAEGREPVFREAPKVWVADSLPPPKKRGKVKAPK